MSEPDTEADRRHYLTGGLRPLDCAHCGTRVLVKKESPQHTSIQWTADSASCPELSAKVAAGAEPGRVESCQRLRESVDAAVRQGRLEVPDPG